MSKTILGVAILAIAMVGCGDDDGHMHTEDGGTPGTDAGPPGMCENAADMAALEATYTVMMEMRDVADVTGACALECIGEPEDMQAACTSACIMRDTMGMISTPCISCLLVSLACTRDSGCISRCISDPAAPDCLACQCGDNTMMRNCRDEFTACSGVPSDDCAGM